MDDNSVNLTGKFPSVDCCPVCWGDGMVVDTLNRRRVCPSCDGKGYIENEPYRDNLD